MIDYHSATYRLADLLRKSSNKHSYRAKRDWLNISYQKRIPAVDSVSQSVHPTEKTALAETSSVQPKGLYRDIGPLAFGVPGTIDSDEQQRCLVVTTGGGWGRLTRALPFCIIMRGANSLFRSHEMFRLRSCTVPSTLLQR